MKRKCLPLGPSSLCPACRSACRPGDKDAVLRKPPPAVPCPPPAPGARAQGCGRWASTSSVGRRPSCRDPAVFSSSGRAVTCPRGKVTGSPPRAALPAPAQWASACPCRPRGGAALRGCLKECGGPRPQLPGGPPHPGERLTWQSSRGIRRVNFEANSLGLCEESRGPRGGQRW